MGVDARCDCPASGALGKHSHGKHLKQAAQAPQAAAYRDPNGTWTVEASTTVGSCPSLIPSSLTLADNKIASGGGANVQVWGYLDEEGNIVARFTGEGEHVARIPRNAEGRQGFWRLVLLNRHVRRQLARRAGLNSRRPSTKRPQATATINRNGEAIRLRSGFGLTD